MNFTHDSTEAFEGIYWSYRWGYLILKDVSALKAGLAPSKVPGDMVIHRSKIAYMQVAP